MDNSKLTFKTVPQTNTNLVGNIKFNTESMILKSAEESENFLIELKDIMTKYKVVSISASFDVFKMLREVAGKSE
ncbi:hypothetical protein LCGC14_0337140 [marine sediment metagenome]|uniref:Uncharacterized protein n=1 Tax=marine sediment metagenome TaxID=412755 RepID=A0A0F9TXK6_9ZZZZ